MNMLKYSILLVIAFGLTSCMSISKFNKQVTVQKHTVDALKKDVDFVFEQLESNHPGVYWYISKEQLDFKVDSLKASFVEPLNTKEFYLKMAPVVNAINCGHTRLLLTAPKLSKKEKAINAESLLKRNTYFISEDKIYLKKVDESLKNLSGLELNAVDGNSAKKILDSLQRFIASDGYNTSFKYALLNRNFSSWYEQIFNVGDTVKFEIKRADSLATVVLHKRKSVLESKPIPLAKEKVATVKIKKNKQENYKGLDENKKPILDYKMVDSAARLAYMKVKSFSFEKANFTKFYRESFEQIEKDSVQHLILDLRDNGGGSLKASRELFSYLSNQPFTYLDSVEVNGRKPVGNSFVDKVFWPLSWATNQFLIYKKNQKYYVNVKGTKELQPKKKAYSGNMYVLVNGLSFSASTLLSANLKALESVTFVGTETGGGFNQCVAGRLPVLKLPNSLLKLRLGLYKLAPKNKTAIVGRGIFPDIEVQRSLNDALQNRDAELETIINKIKSSK